MNNLIKGIISFSLKNKILVFLGTFVVIAFGRTKFSKYAD